MAAENKDDLQALMQKDHARLMKTLDTVDDALAVTPMPEDGITIKDTIDHRTHWIGLFFKWYADGKAGREVHLPAPGYKWNQLKEYNAKVRAASQGKSWQAVLADFADAHDRLSAFIAAADNSELYTEKPYAWTGKWTLGRYAEASGPSHYRSANTYIRKLIRTVSTAASA